MDIQFSDRWDDTNRLLYEILCELKKKGMKEVEKQQETVRQKVNEKETESKIYTCQICKTPYENKGRFLACIRKHKKEGVQNG